MHFRASRLPKEQLTYLLNAICNIQRVISTAARVSAQMRSLHSLPQLAPDSECLHAPLPPPSARVPRTRIDARPLFFLRRGAPPHVFWPPGRGPGPPREFSTSRTLHRKETQRPFAKTTTQDERRPSWDPTSPARVLLLSKSPEPPLYLVWARLRHEPAADVLSAVSLTTTMRMLRRMLYVMEWEMERIPLSPRRVHVWAARINLALSVVPKERYLDLEAGNGDDQLMCRRLAVYGVLGAGTIPRGIAAARHYFFDRVQPTSTMLTTQAELRTLYAIMRVCHSQHFILSALELVLDIWKPIAHYALKDDTWNLPELSRYLGSNIRRALCQLVERFAAAGAPMPWLKRIHESGSPERLSDAASMLAVTFVNMHVSEKALAVHNFLLSVGVDLELRAKLRIVRALTVDDNFGGARALLNSIPDGNRSAAVLQEASFLYGHQGDLHLQERCIENLKALGPLQPYHMLSHLRAAAVIGKVERVLELFAEYRQPLDAGAYTPGRTANWMIKFYEMVMLAYYEAGQPEEAKAQLQLLEREGYRPQIEWYNTMLKYAARSGDVESATAVWKRVQTEPVVPTMITYLELMTLRARIGDADGTQAIMDEAQRRGIQPSRQMVTTLMNAYAEAGHWRDVVRIFKALGNSRFPELRRTVEVFAVVLKAYVRLGAPYKMVHNFFEKMTKVEGIKPTQIIYAILTQSAAETRHYAQARLLYSQMHNMAKIPTVRDYRAMPMGVMLASLLPGRAQELYREMQKDGIELQPDTYAAILRAAARRSWRSKEPPRRLLNSILKHTPIARMTGVERSAALQKIYAPIMKMYASTGDFRNLQRLHEDMVHRGGTPSIVTLWLLMDGFRAAGNLYKVRQLWAQIVQLAVESRDLSAFADVKRTKGSNLLCVPLSTYIHALSAARRHDEISQVWRDVREKGFVYDANNWLVLCIALVNARKLERAYEIVERVFIPAHRQALAALKPGAAEGTEHMETPIAPGDARRRLAAARHIQALLSKQQHDEVLKSMHYSRDPSSPLRILGDISPLWNSWSPHLSLLRLLYVKTREMFHPRNQRAAFRAAARKSQKAVDELVRVRQSIRTDFPKTMKLVRTKGKAEHLRVMGKLRAQQRPRWREYRRWLVKKWLANRVGYHINNTRDTPAMKRLIKRELRISQARRRVPWVAYRKWLSRWQKSWRDLRLLRKRLWLERGRPLQDPHVSVERKIPGREPGRRMDKVESRRAGRQKEERQKAERRKPSGKLGAGKRKGEASDDAREAIAKKGGKASPNGRTKDQAQHAQWEEPPPPRPPWQFPREKNPRPKPPRRTVFWS